MTIRTRAAAIRSFEAVCSDLMPTCPRCGDLSRAGAPFCHSCNGPLTEDAAYGTQLENLKPFYCVNCCRNFAEPNCDVCGADLPLRGEATGAQPGGDGPSTAALPLSMDASRLSGRPSLHSPETGGLENIPVNDRAQAANLAGRGPALRKRV